VHVRDDKKNRTSTIMDINHPAFLFCGAQNREIKKGGHHLPALISSYLAGDNTSSKKLPATKDSTI
jgi:hypothetical protein